MHADTQTQLAAAQAAVQEVEEMKEAVRVQCATIGGDPTMYANASELAENAQRERQDEESLLAMEQEKHDLMASELERLEAAVKSAQEEHAHEAGAHELLRKHPHPSTRLNAWHHHYNHPITINFIHHQYHRH